MTLHNMKYWYWNNLHQIKFIQPIDPLSMLRDTKLEILIRVISEYKFKHFFWHCCQVNATEHLWRLFNIGSAGYKVNIFKMESWNHMGCTGNIIIKDFLRQMCVPLENNAYFGDGDGFNTNPAQVMAWCHKTTSHYLSQCWLRSIQ